MIDIEKAALTQLSQAVDKLLVVGSLFICRYGIIYMTKGGGKNDFKASRKRTEIINGIHR